MAYPPFFNDIGKQPRGIFARGYNTGAIGLVFRSAAPKSGLVFGSSVSHNLTDGKIFGGSELRFAYPSQRLNYVQKWNSNNEVVSELSGADVLTPGLGFGVTTLFAPSTGDYNVASKFTFVHPNAAATMETDVFKSKTLSGGLVVGSDGIYAGMAAVYGMEKRHFDRVQYGLAYDTPAFSVFATLLNSKEAITGLYFRFSDCVETGLALKHDFEDEQSGKQALTSVGVGGRITIDANTMVGAKIDTNGTLSTCYEQKIGTNVTLNFSSAVDLSKLDSGSHKIGLGVTLET